MISVMAMNKAIEAGEPKIVRQLTIGQFEAMFPNEEACREDLYTLRWPNGVRCPRCQNDRVYASKVRMAHWQCKKCGKNKHAPYRFTLQTRTHFEEMKYP